MPLSGNHDFFRQCELGLAEFHKTAQARFKKNNPLSNLVIPKVVSFFNILIAFDFSIICLFFQAPLIRFEQMKKDYEDSWETETLITTFDLDEIETEIEIDYWVCFTVSRSKFWTG